MKNWLQIAKEENEKFNSSEFGKLSDGKIKQLESNFNGGKIVGNKNAKSGHCKRIASLGGKVHAKSGHIQKIGKLGGQRSKELYSKPIEAFCKITGEHKLNFTSAKDAARNGFDGKKVRECLKGKRKTHLGFIWKYKK